MRTDKEEVAEKVKTIAALNRQLAVKDRRIAALEKELGAMHERALHAEEALDPVKESLESMTAERSKWVKKLRRAGLDV